MHSLWPAGRLSKAHQWNFKGLPCLLRRSPQAPFQRRKSKEHWLGSPLLQRRTVGARLHGASCPTLPKALSIGPAWLWIASFLCCLHPGNNLRCSYFSVVRSRSWAQYLTKGLSLLVACDAVRCGINLGKLYTRGSSGEASHRPSKIEHQAHIVPLGANRCDGMGWVLCSPAGQSTWWLGLHGMDGERRERDYGTRK